MAGTTPNVRADAALRRAVAGARRLQKSALNDAFSAENLASRPTPAQLHIMQEISNQPYRYVVAGNQSGKSTLAAREVAWFVERRHPYFKWPKDWSPTESLIVICAGQDRKMLEMIWRLRILPFLVAEEWQEIRSGQMLQQAIHRTRGDQIIFLSHNLGSEHDIKHMQGYAAHFVWVDEMPRSVRVLEELQRRTDSKNSPFLVTFTQKVRNDAIRRFVEKQGEDSRIAKIYRLFKLDNPVFTDRKDDEIRKLEGLSAEQKAAVLSGEWITSDSAVYEYLSDVHGGKPDGYNSAWRHVVSIDPANRSKTGMTLWAESPRDGMWWCVYADYVVGTFAPHKLVMEIEDRIEPFNIVMRIYDSAASWFADAAADLPDGRKIFYTPVTHKANRKEILIANFQIALGTRVRLAEPWAEKLVMEITSYERSEDDPTRILKAQKFHLLDTAHYFVDRIPAPVSVAPIESPHTRLLRLHTESLREQAEKQKRIKSGPASVFTRRWTRW